MKRFSIVCALVLLLNMFCPAVHVHAEEITTPTDVECEVHSYGEYQYDYNKHWLQCSACGKIVNYFDHYDTCSEAGVCGLCKATDVYLGETACESIDFDTYYADADGHWVQCTLCAKKFNLESHIASCGGDGICTVCGAACDVLHPVYGMVSDETYHWCACEDCGEILGEIEQHYTTCDMINGDTAFCWGCDETVPVANCVLEHSFEDAPKQYDEKNHWQACWCGEEINYMEPHEVYCDNPDMNCYCGYEGKVDNIVHTVSEFAPFEWDEYTHWWTCMCGEEKVENWGHSMSCQADYACEVCGYTGEMLNDPVYHNYGDQYEYDEHFHWGVCIDCGGGENISAAHIQQDCKSDICQVCGATFENNEHYGYTDEYEYDEDGHWFICTDCGDKTESQRHMYSCKNPAACDICGYTPAGPVNVVHYFTTKVTDCGDYHAKICPECGEETFIQPHVVSCTNPGACVTCGATDVSTESLSHTTGGYEYDETSHWEVCSTCGEKVYEYTHRASCDAPGVCVDCGLKNDSIPVNDHDVFDSKFYHDENSHWRICSKCGEKAFAGEHYEYCQDANGCCYECGYVGDIEVWHQALMTGWESDADNHWKVCAVCSEKANQAAHDDGDNDGLCDDCGDSVAHVHSWGDPVTMEATCTASGSTVTTCTTCGEEQVEILPSTGHSFEWHSDAEGYHWEYCTKCRLMQNYEQHFTYCSCEDQSVCYFCGKELDAGSMNLIHDFEDMPWQYDSGAHWQECFCGEEDSDHYVHEIYCTEPDSECYCGYTGEVDWMYHNFTQYTYLDADYHLSYCIDCGSEEMNSHWSDDCLTDICAECGGEFEANNHAWPEQYDYDDDGHWFVCEWCNETINDEAHWYTCTSPNTCELCGYTTTGVTTIYHYWTSEIQTDNADYHYKKCSECGEKYDFFAHSVSCDKPGVCTVCGATGITVDHMNHGKIKWEHNDTKHWGVCTVCNEAVDEAPHWTDCSKPDLCQDCGAKNVTIDPAILSHFDVEWGSYEKDATHHWYTCRTCNVKAFYDEHAVDCTEKGICSDCGVAGDFNARHEVLKAGWQTDAANHWKVCALCNEVTNKAAHDDEDADDKCDVCELSVAHVHAWGEPVTVAATCTTDGSKTTTCATCGEKTVETIKAAGHAWGEPVTVAATCTTDGSKTTTCATCGEKTVETIKAAGHAWSEPVTVEATCAADGSKTTTCATCGEATVEIIPALDNHTWKTLSNVSATCTKQGRVEKVCTVCDETSIVNPAAKGHSYGLVFTTQGNGTHAKTCADCGAKQTADCTLTSTELGSMTCSACAICGYTVYTMNDAALENTEDVENPEELTDAKAETTVKRVENVSFELVPVAAEGEATGEDAAAETEAEAEEPVDYSDVVLVVHETVVEMKVELPDTVNAEVKKVLAVTLLKEGASIQPSNKVKLSIPVVEEEVSGLKLVLMTEDGELIELEYEIIDGVMVFETEMVGVFLFVDAAE